MRLPAAINLTLLLATVLATFLLRTRQGTLDLVRPLERIPTELDGWIGGSDQRLAEDVARELSATSYLVRTYRRGSRALELLVSFYASQQGGRSAHPAKNCLPGSGWLIWNSSTVPVPQSGGPVEVSKYAVQNAGGKLLILYWYQFGSRTIGTDLEDKLWLFRDALLNGTTARCVVRLTIADEPGAENDAVHFAAAVIPEIARSFAAPRAAR